HLLRCELPQLVVDQREKLGRDERRESDPPDPEERAEPLPAAQPVPEFKRHVRHVAHPFRGGGFSASAQYSCLWPRSWSRWRSASACSRLRPVSTTNRLPLSSWRWTAQVVPASSAGLSVSPIAHSPNGRMK